MTTSSARCAPKPTGRRAAHLWAIAVIVSLLAVLAPTTPATAQAPDGVVINEVFYHPPCLEDFSPCPDAAAEFIELFNGGNVSVDIGAWQFVDGIEYTFPFGTQLGAGQYLVIADDLAGYSSFFNSSAQGEWTGSLSNNGERIALVDNGGLPIDEITYSDGSNAPGAWSVDADGNGDSLSLLSVDNADGSSIWWDAAAPTPGSVNANNGQSPNAIVTNFDWTVLPNANEDIKVSADVFGGQNVSLQYRINYPGTNQTIPMTLQQGTTWAATIPANAYSAGDLVRFRIWNSGTRVAPRTNDSIKWVGTTISDPSVNSGLPVIEWFTSTANYDAGYAEQKENMFEGVLAYNGQVWDSVEFRIRGKIARSTDWTKRNWRFKFPEHHDFEIDGISYPVDSIDLQGGFADEARIREYVGHTVASEMGLVAPQVQHVQLRLNGEFFGLHTLQEHPEGGFLKDNGLDNASLFKQASEPYLEAGPPASPPLSVTRENWDIPEYINMLAAASVIQNNDFAHGNFYWWLDRDEHGRHEGMIWDLDMSQGIRYAPDEGLTTKLEDGSAWSHVWHRWKNQAPMFEQVLAAPYRELYLRRLRTLADEWFATGRYEQAARDAFAALGSEWDQDVAKWGFWGGQNYTKQGAIDRLADTWIDQYYAHILAGGPDGDIPGPQPSNPNLDLVVNAAPSDQRTEHIQIRNNESTAIDISGWQIGGSATATLVPGSVLPSNGFAYLVADDTAGGYRAVTTDHYVLGEYDAPLNDLGGSIQLTDLNGIAHASTQWGFGEPPASVILNEWNAVSSTNFVLNSDTRLGPVQGNGGDWFELVVVEDHLDLRGWSLAIDDAGQVNQTLTLSNDNVWADLRAGTIITIAEGNITAADGTLYSEDVSYSPEANDWWIHVVGGLAGTGTYITATDYRVSKDDWRLSIYDTTGTRRFGPAGEGIGSLAAGGISNTEVGELEQDPDSSITASSNYGDGDESTFGLPNNFDGRSQDFAAIRPEVVRMGDVTCDGVVNVLDAVAVAQYVSQLRVDSGGCPLGDAGTEMNLAVANVDSNATVNVLDAVIIAQCSANLNNVLCPQ